MTIPQESYTGTVNTVKEVSSATLSSPNTHPSFLGIEGPLPCGSLMPPVRAPNPQGKDRSLQLIILPSDFNSEISDVVLVILQRRSLLASCRFVAAPHRASLGSQTSTCLLNREKSHCRTEGHSPQPSCADRSRHMLSLFRLRCTARIQPTH